MTAKELIKVLETLPDDQYVGFSLENLRIAKERIGGNLETRNSSALLILVGYERCNIGDEEDELFILKFNID